MKQLIQTSLKAASLFLIIAVILTTGCQQPKPDPSVELKPLLDKGVAIWNNGNVEEFDGIIDPNYVRIVNQIPDVKGVEGAKKVVTAFRTSYPDLKLTIDEAIYAENRITARWSFTGTNKGPGEMPPTGKQVKFWGIVILHYANGKCIEERVAYDNQSLMEQLGFTMMPPAAEKK